MKQFTVALDIIEASELIETLERRRENIKREIRERPEAAAHLTPEKNLLTKIMQRIRCNAERELGSEI